MKTFHSGDALFAEIEKKERDGAVDPKFIGDFQRNKQASTFDNLTYEQMSVIQWYVVNKLDKKLGDFDWGAIRMGDSLDITKNSDGTYSIKGSVPYLPRADGKTPNPLPTNASRV